MAANCRRHPTRSMAERDSRLRYLPKSQKTPEGVRFEGEMVCEGYHSEQAPDSEGNQRQAIVFELRPLDAIAEHVEAEPITDNAPLSELRARAIASSANVAKAATTSTKNVYERSRDVRRYVLARSKGKCEGCSGPAPFSRPDGTPYLEPHHLKRLSDGRQITLHTGSLYARTATGASMRELMAPATTLRSWG